MFQAYASCVCAQQKKRSKKTSYSPMEHILLRDWLSFLSRRGRIQTAVTPSIHLSIYPYRGPSIRPECCPHTTSPSAPTSLITGSWLSCQPGGIRALPIGVFPSRRIILFSHYMGKEKGPSSSESCHLRDIGPSFIPLATSPFFFHPHHRT